ncbi:helix-turn-helix domain-containing protein [Nitratireductor alexandrii]|uniref:helix-turn-helix domain-containing protein n=1 Tax=Nitratireductor alexandrii TaxID=2448161 RepID=UPI001EE7F28B|nr:helix-turn-helix domain-containing protein [Nitratireductor alexandrii]
MGKPLPMALRERVAAYVDEGHGHREAARHFRVSPRFVNELMKRRRETGSLEPRRQGHAPGWGKLAPHVGFVRGRMAHAADLTLDELCVEEARGCVVHRSSVGRLLHRLGLSHKKLYAQASSYGLTSRPRGNSGRRAESRSSPRPCRASSSSTRPRPTPS